MRQIIGYIEDCRADQGVNIAVPGFGHLCDLFELLARRGDTSTMVDSTGMSFGSRESEGVVFANILNL